MLVYYKAGFIIISSYFYLFLPWYSCKIAHLALNNNQLTHYSGKWEYSTDVIGFFFVH